MALPRFPGWTMAFEEQDGPDWDGVHVHAWLSHEPSSNAPWELFSWIFGDDSDFYDIWPQRLLSICTVVHFDVNMEEEDQEEGVIVFDDQAAMLELVLKGKLTEGLMFHVARWAEDTLDMYFLSGGFMGLQMIESYVARARGEKVDV